MIRLLVGLGNPGAEYEATRHNAGVWWLEAAARRLGASLVAERAYQGLAARVTRHGQPVWLLAPQTYMNLSGRSVGALARFFKIAPGEILVAHDELDLPPGQVRLKQGGGHAGHNGLRDIHAQMGADYWRLRLGIGHPGDRDAVSGYVLGKPIAADREAIEAAIAKSVGALDALLDGDMAVATRVIHAGVERPRPPRAAKPQGDATGEPARDGAEPLPGGEGDGGGRSAAPISRPGG